MSHYMFKIGYIDTTWKEDLNIVCLEGHQTYFMKICMEYLQIFANITYLKENVKLVIRQLDSYQTACQE
jgi:hypothetical protein